MTCVGIMMIATESVSETEIENENQAEDHPNANGNPNGNVNENENENEIDVMREEIPHIVQDTKTLSRKQESIEETRHNVYDHALIVESNHRVA